MSGILAALVLACPAFATNVLDRDEEAVVFLGSAVPGIVGTAPNEVLAFRWEGGWVRIPVQVDERAAVDFATIYGDPDPSGFTVLTYTDPGTFTGPDPEPRLDADDEIVLLARDAGELAPPGAGIPSGTLADGGTQLALTRPSGGPSAWVYLFRGDGTLPPLPPSSEVAYDFVLLSGDYKTTYKTGGNQGGNPERSTVTTSSYWAGFSDRWMRVETGILRDGASGTDLLERHRNRFGPDVCTRTEWTFSMGEGAFIVNKNGPVRALRGYVGANSGVTTYRIHLFYPTTEVIRTVLRVHEIPGVMDFLDWDAAASGMTWRNDRNPVGVPVDGIPDAVSAGAYLWESWSGPLGSLAAVLEVDTDIPGFTWTSWYSDSIPAEAAPCPSQGDDDRQYGSSGLWRDGPIANTDPAVVGDVYRMTLKRTMRYLGPHAPPTAGPALRGELDDPLGIAFSSYAPSTTCADADGDLWAVCVDDCEPPPGSSCGDCDDASPEVWPGAAEICDGIDQDCDGLVDDGLPLTTWYLDRDGDGYGDPSATTSTCDPSPPAGYAAVAGDCDDTRGDISPSATEICDGIDQDCDGLVDDGLAFTTWYRDSDGDGYGDPSSMTSTCDPSPPDGYAAVAGDCDDTRGDISPSATEVCDGVDQDCDGLVDDGLAFTTWYRDSDGDGYGTASNPRETCDSLPPAGHVDVAGDCDDSDPSRRPDATEVCDGVDQDCDGLVDDGLPLTTWYLDRDGDRYGSPSATTSTCDPSPPTGYAAVAGDCDDTRADVFPAAPETCDGVDQDCDGLVDDGLPLTTWYLDRDGDGYGDPSATHAACGDAPPAGYVVPTGDCDDTRPDVFPSAPETCNGTDDDCDGVVDENLPDCGATACLDGDGDGWAACGGDCTPAPGLSCGDCDDADPGRNPQASEVCDGRDDDCDGVVDDGLPFDPWYLDADQDGYGRSADSVETCDGPPAGHVGVGGDCDDGDPLRHPEADESCNTRDDDCDGAVDEGLPLFNWYPDEDGDGAGRDDSSRTSCDSTAPAGHSASAGDCDDADASIRPGAPETCDGVDNDCSPASADGAGEPWIGEACDGGDADFCSGGNAICSGGSRRCDDDPRSAVDVCDGMDNDCDSVADNPACAAFDVDGNGRVDGFELAWVGRAFGSCRSGPDAPWWSRVDFDGDGCVDGDDLVILANLWARPCTAGTLCP